MRDDVKSLGKNIRFAHQKQKLLGQIHEND